MTCLDHFFMWKLWEVKLFCWFKTTSGWKSCENIHHHHHHHHQHQHQHQHQHHHPPTAPATAQKEKSSCLPRLPGNLCRASKMADCKGKAVSSLKLWHFKKREWKENHFLLTLNLWIFENLKNGYAVWALSRRVIFQTMMGSWPPGQITDIFPIPRKLQANLSWIAILITPS